MKNHLHHTHIFASNISESIRFYTEAFGGKVVFDADFAGARNVFMRIGTGRLHLYDQPPKNRLRGSIHHIGIQADDIGRTVERIKKMGIELRKDVIDLGVWKYIMVPAPDEILVELFEVDKSKLPDELMDFFE